MKAIDFGKMSYLLVKNSRKEYYYYDAVIYYGRWKKKNNFSTLALCDPYSKGKIISSV